MIDLTVLAPPIGTITTTSFGDRLHAGIDELSAADEQAVCDQESMTASIVEAVDRLTGLRAHIANHSRAITIVFALPDRTWASLAFSTPRSDDVWFDESTGRAGRPVGRTLGHRSATVASQLRRFYRSTDTVEDFIASPHQPRGLMRDLGDVLPLWWESRLDEGQTPESARVLLGLTLAPNAWPHLSWDALGRPSLPVVPNPATAPHLTGGP